MTSTQLRGFLSSWWAGIFGQARLSRVGEGASITDTLRIATPAGDQPIDCVRLESFGDVICPPVEAATIAWTKSEGGVCLSLGVANLRPTDAKQGDRFLYCSKVGTAIKLRGDSASHAGRIEIDAAEHVVVNGGTQPVARKDDGVWAGDIRIETSNDGGMPPKDIVSVYFVSRDPADPAYLTAVKILEFKVQGGDVLFPPVGPPPAGQFTVKLTGVITRGADRFDG